jgi:hypothetical protein
MALEQRLFNQSMESGVSLDRLRRRVIFERIVARLQAADPGRWVLKGGMALEVRLGDDARLTKDIDLGLRAEVSRHEDLQERLVDALALDPFDDMFVLTAGAVTQLMEDGAGHVTWRSKVAASLALKRFGAVQLDVSPRPHELAQTEVVALPNSLAFAGIDSPTIEIIDVNRHGAEKYHAMLKDFGDRENSRVRDLVDLVILVEHEMLEPRDLAAAVVRVWQERDGIDPPADLPPLPESWPPRYEQLALDHVLTATSFPAAVLIVTELWADMFGKKET